jgi:hypothetical protein
MGTNLGQSTNDGFPIRHLGENMNMTNTPVDKDQQIAALRKELKEVIGFNTKLVRDFKDHVGKPNQFINELVKYRKQINRDKVLLSVAPSEVAAVTDMLNALDFYIDNLL